ncbi:MAG: XAC2610-related protein [Candidatus Korobacteraceae bacterium]|jgi:hypothetical protein
MRQIAILIVAAMMTAASSSAANSGTPQQSTAVTGSPIPGEAGYGVDLGLDPTSGKILELLVYHGQKQVQALKVCTSEAVPRESPVGTMDTADYNFDGHGDLALETAFKQGNASYCIWLFDPKTKQFVASPQLSQLTNPRPDPKTRTVISSSKGGCIGCSKQETYRWSKGQLIPVREETVTQTDLGMSTGGDCGWLRTVKEEKNGKMVFVSRDQINSLGQTCLPGQ